MYKSGVNIAIRFSMNILNIDFMHNTHYVSWSSSSVFQFFPRKLGSHFPLESSSKPILGDSSVALALIVCSKSCNIACNLSRLNSMMNEWSKLPITSILLPSCADCKPSIQFWDFCPHYENIYLNFLAFDSRSLHNIMMVPKNGWIIHGNK